MFWGWDILFSIKIQGNSISAILRTRTSLQCISKCCMMWPRRPPLAIWSWWTFVLWNKEIFNLMHITLHWRSSHQVPSKPNKAKTLTKKSGKVLWSKSTNTMYVPFWAFKVLLCIYLDDEILYSNSIFNIL